MSSALMISISYQPNLKSLMQETQGNKKEQWFLLQD